MIHRCTGLPNLGKPAEPCTGKLRHDPSLPTSRASVPSSSIWRERAKVSPKQLRPRGLEWHPHASPLRAPVFGCIAAAGPFRRALARPAGCVSRSVLASRTSCDLIRGLKPKQQLTDGANDDSINFFMRQDISMRLALPPLASITFPIGRYICSLTSSGIQPCSMKILFEHKGRRKGGLKFFPEGILPFLSYLRNVLVPEEGP